MLAMPLVVVITEGIPVHAVAAFYSYSVSKGKTQILGPNCPGIISPGKTNLGIIPADITGPGQIGLVSKSGTLTYQMMFELRDFGFTTAVGIGGDPIIGTTHIDCLRAFQDDPETKAIVMIGEALTLPSDWQASIAPGEYLIESPTGRRTVQLVRIDEGSRSIVQIQDISANIHLHQQSQQENRLAAMGKMAASIAHQFRTPLATALLYSSHLCDGKIAVEESKEFAERLRKQLLGLEKLSQDMLRFITEAPKRNQGLTPSGSP